jgi:hypothetical protein
LETNEPDGGRDFVPFPIRCSVKGSRRNVEVF